ncbi:hypothetical protein [Sulfuracidifex tepidarius]|uniref:Energy-coupling factor transport system substrate-specific component n=1 Tax=Sulfuracidifex tepidarius TaxID=1294262 RepID=A0A510E2N1_9CREN|nr:hypothetical protein [Sulfuracidifex tepidarius]BBG23972.1 hypothetical protein IC006_1272 [Sulfuracidifex tepidarius]BBG26727.1 hypothetical protein IC007_1247 [Sulfuracidifex tepidarius]
METRKKVLYASVFSVASFAAAAAIATTFNGYAINAFADPIANLTLPLIILAIGIQIINEKYGPILIALISALLYTIAFLPFLSVSLLAVGIIVEIVTRKIGYRSLSAVITYTTIAGTGEGILSTYLAYFMVKVPVPMPGLLDWVVFSVIMAIESAAMGAISFKVGNYVIRSGVIKEERKKAQENKVNRR